MKIAVLVSGTPRFCKDFNFFIGALERQGHELDWFFSLSSPNVDLDKQNQSNLILVAPKWKTIDHFWATEKIEWHLGSDSKLVSLDVFDPLQINIPSLEGNIDGNVGNIYRMHWAWKRVNDLRLQHELQNGPYDLIIRTRPDIFAGEKINLTEMKEIIDLDPSTVIMQKEIHGYNYKSNDFLSIANSETTNIYTDIISHTVNYHKENVVFHPETLLGYHLQKNNLRSMNINLKLALRVHKHTAGPWEVMDFAQWQF